jgi:D-methionine transport system ATP-binding protein
LVIAMDQAVLDWQPDQRDESVPVLQVSKVSRRFGSVTALDDISFTLGAGQVLGIIGRSGAGKSTLIRCLNGLERPDAGRIEIEGRDVTRLSERGWQKERQRIGMIFQHFNLLSARTVIQNVALPLKLAGVAKAERLARATALLDLVGAGLSGASLRRPETTRRHRAGLGLGPRAAAVRRSDLSARS